MRTRILKPEDWGSVDAPDLPLLLPFVAPQNIAIIAAENAAGERVGYLSALRVTHLEGLWVRPGQRGGRVAFELFRQGLALALARDETWVIGGAANGDSRMDDLIRRVNGVPLALRFYTIPAGGA